jgi:co-chaperonin GroES (HSP10)
MKMYSRFVVKLDKRFNDTIELSNGTELYLDTKFNEFAHRVNEGEVTHTPIKYKTDINVGDTLYFHHLVVLNEEQKVYGLENHYMVNYDPELTINNQCIAVKKKDTGEIKPIGGWVVLSPIEKKEEECDAWLSHLGIELVSLEDDNDHRKGTVAFECDKCRELGIKEGDVIGFRKNGDYRFKIDGIEYFRLHPDFLLYVEEN